MINDTHSILGTTFTASDYGVLQTLHTLHVRHQILALMERMGDNRILPALALSDSCPRAEMNSDLKGLAAPSPALPLHCRYHMVADL